MRLRSLLALVLALLSHSVLGQASAPEAEHLVSAIGYVPMFKARAQNYVRIAPAAATPQARNSQEFARRVIAMPNERLLAIFARVFARFLSSSEQIEIASLFETPFGRKLAQGSLAAYESYGGDVLAARDSLSLTAEDREEMAKLATNRAWQRYREVTESKELNRALVVELTEAPEFSDLR